MNNILFVTDIYNEHIRINMKNIAYYYQQGEFVQIHTNGGIVTATDIDIKELDNFLRTYEINSLSQ